MAMTVNSAFNEFNRDYVNLDWDRTKIARRSRNWLIGQLNNLPDKVDNFPIFYTDRHIKFGSFARNTKIRPLDDIDLILAFSANGTTYTEPVFGTTYTLNTENGTSKLKALSDNGVLNSRKVVNKIVSSLSKIEHYQKAEIHRRQEAVTLELDSYEWKFDIVPAFYTTSGLYLIPDGEGNWKATDPRIDQDNVTNVNQKHDSKILQIIRTLKYWQKRANMPTMSSYFFETMILNYFNSQVKISDWIDENMINFLGYLENEIYNSVNDPKGFQGDLNHLSFEEKCKVSEKIKSTKYKALKAYHEETSEKNISKSILLWREIFGSDFPKYG